MDTKEEQPWAVLKGEDALNFIRAINADPNPSQNLKDAMKRYLEETRGSSTSSTNESPETPSSGAHQEES